MKRIAALALAGTIAATAAAAAPPAPRFVPERDLSATYRISQPGRADQTWQVRFDAAGQRVRARSLAGTPMPLTVFLNLGTGRAEVALPQMHALVEVPGLSGVIGQVMAARDARFTTLGTATIAGLRCTRYLVLRPDGSGTACLTPTGIALAASGHDRHGNVRVRALSVDVASQPAQEFVPPDGYAHVNLPPAMLAQIMGG